MAPTATELVSDMTKRRKIDSPTKNASPASKVFAPFRTLGLVTDSTPFAVTSLGQSYLLTTVVDRSFQIYDASNLHLLFISQPRTPAKITCVHSHFHHVFAAWDTTVGIYKRGKLEATIELDEQHLEPNSPPISNILLFGEYLCVTAGRVLFVYRSASSKSIDFKLYTTFVIPSESQQIKYIVHPPTYLNKVVIATASNLFIFNVRSGKLLFTSLEFYGSISALETAPVLDIAAVATTSGEISLYNLRKGKSIFTLSLGENISSLSFRTDGTPHLAVGTTSGHLFFYDLNTKRRIHSVRDVHNDEAGGVSRVHYLNGQSIVVSNGGDNLIQELIFDPAVTYAQGSSTPISAPPRILRSRGGHSRPPTSISFTDEQAHFILSASQDQSLWSFSLRRDNQSHEFSQRTSATANGKRMTKIAGRSLREKFPEITALAYEADKQSRWDNILTAHKNQTFARSWSGARGIVGKYNLSTVDGGIVKSVAISQCGNFGLVGSSNGGIGVYNLQSGELRRKIVKAGHSKSVTGLCSDNLNTTIISTSLDGDVFFNDFHTGNRLKKLSLGSSIIDMRYHSRSNLLAVSLDSLCISIIDCQTQKVVRELWGHDNRITSFDFTPDGRWVISASLDSTIRTWDIPSGGCIDAVRVDSVVTCLRVSPNGEWLATAHVQGAGIQLWTQKSQFQKISTRHISEEEIRQIEMPNSTGEGGANILEGAFTADSQEDADLDDYVSPASLSDELQTLSLLPGNKYNTLLYLDVIRQRNKPKEAPKAPEKAPFFLGGLKGDKLDAKTESHEESNGPNQPKLNSSIVSAESKFTQLLRRGEYAELIVHIKGLSPSSTDLEIRSLNTFAPLAEFVSFINALTYQLQQKKDYEFVQAWMAILLRIHGDVILANTDLVELTEALQAWEDEQVSEAKRLDLLAKYCSGVLMYLRTA